ncbi:MAG TPA: polymorphic toxin type 44 domain-containing protein [Stackebrandtia sp.]|uniref:polymorphic toxin type 44 domain-containing protein n=1 Tax=Stackebrandtia sp. TaxID=2023065 RepID=UPI002D72652E|nr:polymorphic toxin type 44 domain-containing protein [Stackebrandtia sp.]HZE41326.1 polymorphic toxin type 44 domain-containing protein [Stackebrandtia sp.]
MDFKQLTTMDISALHGHGTAFRRLSSTALDHSELIDGLGKKIPASWRGSDSDVAARRLTDHSASLGTAGDRLGRVAAATTRATSALLAAQGKARRAAGVAGGLDGGRFDAAAGRVDYQWREDLWGPWDRASPRGKANFHRNVALANQANADMAAATKDAQLVDRTFSGELSKLGPDMPSKDSPAEPPGAPVPDPDKDAKARTNDGILKYITDEMNTNGGSWTTKGLWLGNHSLSLGGKAGAYAEFYRLVKTNGPWDHKPKIRERFGMNVKDPTTLYSYDPKMGKYLRYDIWSNIHYGFVGKKAGFTEIELMTAQNLGTGDTGKKDPADDVAVKIGFELADKYKPGELTPAIVEQAVLAHQKDFEDAAVKENDPGFPVVK